MSTLLGINITYQKAKITSLGTLLNSTTVTQARVVGDTDGNVYLEIYYSTSSSNAVRVSILEQVRYFGGMINFETAPSTSTVFANKTIRADYFDYEIIPENSDLNNYRTPGFYYNDSNTQSATISHVPTGNAFSLLVERHAGIKQTFTTYQTSTLNIYVRNYYNDTWGAWQRIPTRKSLYSNTSGTTGTVTLSETSANFNHLEIMYGSDGVYHTKKISDPNGKGICLFDSHVMSDTKSLYLYGTNYVISGTSISVGAANNSAISNTGTVGTNSTTPYVKIYSVAGYR